MQDQLVDHTLKMAHGSQTINGSGTTSMDAMASGLMKNKENGMTKLETTARVGNGWTIHRGVHHGIPIPNNRQRFLPLLHLTMNQ